MMQISNDERLSETDLLAIEPGKLMRAGNASRLPLQPRNTHCETYYTAWIGD